MAPQIRRVTSDEFQTLAELTEAAYCGLSRAPAPEYLAELRDVARRAAAAVALVAVDEDGRLLGGVTYVPDARNPLAEFTDVDAAGIRMLAVAPAAQGRGVGRSLVEACLERARQDGRRRVLLHTTPWMKNAQRLYESLGFRRDPTRDRTPIPEVTLLGYVRELTA